MAEQNISILEMGQGGLNRDDPPFTLSPGTWSAVRNVNMRNGMISSAAGFVDKARCDTGMEVRHLLPFPVTNQYFWNQSGLVSGVGTICLSDGVGSRVVTPSGGIAIQDGDQWTGGVLNGVPLMCNGAANTPFYLPDPDAVGIWTPLPFDATDSWLTKDIQADVIRTFKNFIFAFGIHRDAGYYPHLVMWSDAADPGTIPYWQDWTSLDATILAGEQLIGETSGYLVDALPLNDLLMIYKEDSIWSADLIESSQVFRFRQAIPTVGALAPNCIGVFQHGHVVLGDGDVIRHNGTTAVSIIADRLRRELFRMIDGDNYRNSFLIVDHEQQEVLCCIPESGAVYPTVAATWNWRHDTWTLRDLPPHTFWITYGVDNFGVGLASDAWGSDPGETDIFGNVIPPGDPNYAVPYTPAIWGDLNQDPTDPNPTPPPPYLKPWGSREFNPTLRALIGSYSLVNANYWMTDTFTASDDTPIHTHIADTGQGWTQTDPFTPAVIIKGNQVQTNGILPEEPKAWSLLDTPDVSITLDVTYEGGGAGILFRYNSAAQHLHAFTVWPGSNEVVLRTGTSEMQAVPVPNPPAPGVAVTLKVEADGDDVKCWIDNDLVFDQAGLLVLSREMSVGLFFEQFAGQTKVDNLDVSPLQEAQGLFRIDQDYVTWFDRPVVCRAERVGIPLFGNDNYGKVSRVYPLMEATGFVDFYIGVQMHPNDAVGWKGPFKFNPNLHQYFDVLIEVNLLAFRIETVDGAAFRLYGLKADAEVTGKLYASI